jgi:hypothetical protein
MMEDVLADLDVDVDKDSKDGERKIGNLVRKM